FFFLGGLWGVFCAVSLFLGPAVPRLVALTVIFFFYNFFFAFLGGKTLFFLKVLLGVYPLAPEFFRGVFWGLGVFFGFWLRQ
ncbi:MFS transporter, partial [Enterobacter intestinihominis]